MEIKQPHTALMRAPLVMAFLWVLAACVRDMARVNSIDVPEHIYFLYAISGNFFYPAIFFFAGSFCGHFFVNPKRNPISFSWQWLGYSFVVWVVLQNLIEVVFSGYTDSAAVVSDIYYDFVTKPQNHLWILLALALTLPVLYAIARFKTAVKILLAIFAVHCCLNPDKSTLLYPLNLVTNYLYFSLLGLLLGDWLSRLVISRKIALLLTVLYLVVSVLWIQFVDHRPYIIDTKNFIFSHLGIVFIIAVSQLINLRNTSLQDSLKLALLLFVMHYIGVAGIRTVLLKTFHYTGAHGHLFAGVLLGIVIPYIAYRMRTWRIIAITLEAPRALRIYRRGLPQNDVRYTLFAKIASVCCISLIAGYTILYTVSESILAKSRPDVVNASDTINKETFDTAELSEGKRLAYLYGCAGGCHGGGMTGKSYHRVPFKGVYHAPNLRESVRRYNDSELLQIVKAGERPEGHPIMLGMPVAGFASVPDVQLQQVFNYIRSLPFEGGDSGGATLGPITRMELILGTFKNNETLVAEADQFFNTVPEASERNGQHWARAVCTECHGLSLQGNEEVRSPPLLVAKAYNIEQFKTLLREGVPPDGRDLGLMKQVARVRFNHFTDQEIEQIFAFLYTL
ncbi:hypothetical protein P886_1117 [Alteromonadaceae bacterium 2753L.S.0a.02]|nr:hypothetical protein P886_1117 [Alteromonadaceae bacterium 2753L.S.0a.02]